MVSESVCETYTVVTLQKLMNRSKCCLDVDVDVGGPEEPCVRWGQDSPKEWGTFGWFLAY